MLGGVASRRRLEAMTSRRAVARALVSGDVVAASRSVCRLADLDRSLARATDLGGRVAVVSAAVAHGWEVAAVPDRPWVMLDHSAHRARAVDVHLVWGDLRDEPGLVTSERRTLLDCARRLPFAQALAVADSALRHGRDLEEFAADATAVRGKGAAAAREVALHASPLAANPFESVLRALAIRAGLDVRPQVELEVGDGERRVRPDLVDVGRRLVLEADSWEFHGSKQMFQQDCWRYTALVVDGWTVLRFTWWQVMFEPDWVLACLESVRGKRETLRIRRR